MSVIFKTIRELDKHIEAHAERFTFKHPYLSFFALFIGMPICILATVFFFISYYYNSYRFDLRMAVRVLM